MARWESLVEMRDEAMDCLRHHWRDGGWGLREEATRILVAWKESCFAWRLAWRVGIIACRVSRTFLKFLRCRRFLDDLDAFLEGWSFLGDFFFGGYRVLEGVVVDGF